MCFYSPVSYVLPALAIKLIARPHEPGRSYIIEAFYAARLANLILMALAVRTFLVGVPGFRNLTLILYSLPTAIQQTVSINQESTIFALMFAMLILWWRTPSNKQLALLLIPIGLLMAVKIIYGLMFVLWLCGLVRLWTREGNRPVWWLFMLPVIPLYLAYRWNRMGAHWTYSYLLPGANPDIQMAQLREHPAKLFMLFGEQFLDLLGRGHLTGGWTTVVGVLGWADFEIGNYAYALFGLAVLAAIFADLLSGRPMLSPVKRAWIDLVFSRILPILSVFALVPAFGLVLYLIFTGVGGDRIVGVVGRFLHFPYFVALIFGLDWIKHARGTAIGPQSGAMARVSHILGICCVISCVFALGLSVHQILSVYWLS